VITTPIPLFPLGLVLLPGASVPLHLFEPRYRTMLQDVASSDNRFGLIAPPQDVSESRLPAGRIGCLAHIVASEVLPDGRANIVVEGETRFRFDGYVDAGTPYRMGAVSAWDDTPDLAESLASAAERLMALALRAVTASMTIHDVTSPAPAFGDDPALLSFQVAQLLRTGNDTLYALLAERSPLLRMQRIEKLLRTGLGDLEEAADLHVRAKTNGHHHGPPPG